MLAPCCARLDSRGGCPHMSIELEIYSEICLDYLFAGTVGIVAEDQVVAHGQVLRGGKTEAYVLIVGRVDGVDDIGGATTEEVGVLLFIHQKKIDVSTFIGGLEPGVFWKRVISAVQLRAGGVSGNVEQKLSGGRDSKSFVHDGGAGAYGRGGDVIVGMRLPRPYWLVCFRRAVVLRHQDLERTHHRSHNRIRAWVLDIRLGGHFLESCDGLRLQLGRVILVIGIAYYQ